VGHSGGSPSDLGSSYSNQRSVPRYSFVAVAQLTENSTQACLMGRITAISRKGCYVDVPLPENALPSVVISHDRRSFATKAKVLYAHEGIGMGVAFLDPANDQLKVLDSWLAELPLTDRQ
jgi:hypothetical protein